MNTSRSQSTSPLQKALACNNEPSIYGVFAEIGAGQEVANHFFQAGNASGTIAKTMSAYDMTISDSIYGRSPRYVSQPRLEKMLDHEHSRLVDRLNSKQGTTTRFFTFANTVTTRSVGPKRNGHGWMGIRFQTKPGGATNTIIIHVRLFDNSSWQQRAALALAGVNLVHGVFFTLPKDPHKFVESLMDNLKRDRIEIDLIRFHGDDLKHIDTRLMNLYLVEKKFTDAICFDSKGEPVNSSDLLYEKPVLLHRATFRPITVTHIDNKKQALKQFASDFPHEKPLPIMEITMHNLSKRGKIDKQDFLHRVDLLNATGHHVMVSNFYRYFEIKCHLRERTQHAIAVSMSAMHLKYLFMAKYYEDVPGGILEGFGKLTHGNAKIYVHEEIRPELTINLHSFKPSKELVDLFLYLQATGKFVHLKSLADFTTHSDEVIELLQAKKPKWKELVPSVVANMIQKRKLFR